MISEYNVNGIENKFKSAWKCQIQRKELKSFKSSWNTFPELSNQMCRTNDFIPKMRCTCMIAMDMKKEFYLEIESQIKCLMLKLLCVESYAKLILSIYQAQTIALICLHRR